VTFSPDVAVQGCGSSDPFGHLRVHGSHILGVPIPHYRANIRPCDACGHSLQKWSQLPERLAPFDFTRPEDSALFFLLIRLKWFMQETTGYPTVKARVFIDEGYKKNGVAIQIPTFESAFADGLVCFASSSCILPIQLADFAAFALIARN